MTAPLIDNLLSLQVTGGLQTIEESDLQRTTTESGESEPDFNKENISTKFIFTPNANHTLSAEFTNTQQQRTHNPGKSLLASATRTYSELEKNNYVLSHDAKYDDWVSSSYIQFDQDQNNAITGRTVGKIQNPGGILVVFWASWCPACNKEMPYIKEYYNEFKKNGGEIIAISLDYDQTMFNDATKELPWFNYTDLMRWDSPIAASYQVEATPTIFLLDKDNKIINKVSHVNELIQTK